MYKFGHRIWSQLFKWSFSFETFFKVYCYIVALLEGVFLMSLLLTMN